MDGRPVGPAAAPVWLMLHKPPGYVTTLSDERGRPTVARLVEDCGVRVYPVGRLDLLSEGLLLLTNDGAAAHRLLHPSHQVEKRYRVLVEGDVSGCVRRLERLDRLEDGTPIAPARARLIGGAGERAELEIVIHQGLNRQIRRMCAMAGLRVLRLIRVGEGPLSLGDLPSGRWRLLTPAERRALLAAGVEKEKRP